MRAVNYAAFAVSIVAVIIAGIALWRTEHRATRAERRDEQRMKRKEEAAAAARRANPVLVPDFVSGGPTAEQVHHCYVLRNLGPAVITEVTIWIEDDDGHRVSTPSGDASDSVPLTRDDPPVQISVDVPQPIPDRQTLFIEWVDADGRHREERGHPPRHA